MKLSTLIKQFCEEQIKAFNKIDAKRKEDLKVLSAYFKKQFEEDKLPKAIAICTHNSRRSHFTQIWLAVAATFYNKKIETFSGGTEVTALNINVVNTLKEIGFAIDFVEEENPKFKIAWSEEEEYIAFSKVYDDKVNPKKDFAAIMVCNAADKNCPIVFGADLRIALPFNDPKEFDGTTLQKQKYMECCEIIATEMLFVVANAI